MARRNFANAVQGQVYCIEWPEWHVECAHPHCGETVVVSPTGECDTLREAEKAANHNRSGQLDGWKKERGLWYCPKH